MAVTRKPLTRKTLMLDAERVRALAERLGMSEAAAVREAIERVLFADEFGDLLGHLREAGFGVEEPPTVGDEQRDGVAVEGGDTDGSARPLGHHGADRRPAG